MGSRLTTTESMYRKKRKHYIGVQDCIKSKEIFNKKRKKKRRKQHLLKITDLVPSQLFFWLRIKIFQIIEDFYPASFPAASF